MSAAYTGPSALLVDVAAAIKADLPVISAIQTLYGHSSALSFYLGVDTNELPAVSFAPYLAFKPGDYSPDDKKAFKNIGFTLALVINNKAVTGDANTRIYQMTGLSDLEKLVPLINDVIFDLFLTKFGRSLKWSPIQTDVFPPEFRATWAVSAQDEIS